VTSPVTLAIVVGLGAGLGVWVWWLARALAGLSAQLAVLTFVLQDLRDLVRDGDPAPRPPAS
jgi:hypothetical protein